MNKQNDLKSQIPAIREALEKGKKVEFETHGHSMIPLLHDGGDRVIIQLNTTPLKINDVALCKTDTSKFVLHRVIALSDGGYILKGDNCVNTERCLSDNDVIGVACAFIRRGKLLTVEDKKYLYYVNHRKPLLMLWRSFWFVADFFMTRFRCKNRGN